MAILDATRTTQVISRDLMVAILHAVKGAKMVSIISQTDPGRNKACAGHCVKQSHVNGVINFHYENAVNRQQAREGGEATFEAKPRKWGERIKGTPLVTHKGFTYLELKVEKALKTEYFIRQPGGVLAPCQKSDVEEWLRPTRPSGGRQGVQREVVLRDYKMASIIEIRMGGICYQLTD